MELRFGSALREDFKKFWKKIESEIISRVKVLTFGHKEALLAGDILAGLRKSGQITGVEDVLIAATAIANQSTVVTGNVEHFSRIQGLNVENWLKPV
jgi:tRNA(fMet)-specific endonuclease VapC